MMTATSGRLFEMPYATWDPGSSCWRTSGAISASGSGTFSGTWPTSGSMRDGACFEHPTWGHPTSAPASSLLPTPVTADAVGGRNATNLRWEGRTAYRPSGAKASVSLQEATALLPTPRSNEANGTGDHGTGGPDLRTLVDQLLPTPTASDAVGARNRTANRPPNSKHHDGVTLTDVFWIGDRTDPPSNDGNTSTDPHQPQLSTGD